MSNDASWVRGAWAVDTRNSPPTRSMMRAAGLDRRSVLPTFIRPLFRLAASEPLRSRRTVCPGRPDFRGSRGFGRPLPLGVVARIQVLHGLEPELPGRGVLVGAGLGGDHEAHVVADVEPAHHRAGHPPLDPLEDGHATGPGLPCAALELVDLV